MSAIVTHLLDSLDEDAVAAPVNDTTLHRQAVAAVDWLLHDYLFSWLELLEGAVKCEYPRAMAQRVRLQVLSNLRHDLQGKDLTACVFELASIETFLRSILKDLRVAPDERAMQWGVWGRDVPISIAYGFQDAKFLDDTVPKQISACAMQCAFLVSQLVTDDGVAEEISHRMFDAKPRALLALLQSIPAAPEA